MTVIIVELSLLKLRIEFCDFFQEFQIAPQPPRGGGFGIPLDGVDKFLVVRIFLPTGIYELAIALLVPPCIAEIRVDEKIALVHVTVHALGARDRPGELVLDGMRSEES